MSKKINLVGILGPEKSTDEKIQGLGVLLEHMDSKIDLVLELTQSTQTSLERKIDALDVRLTGEIHSTQAAVRSNREAIRTLEAAVGGNSEDIQALKAAVGGNSEEIIKNRQAIQGLDRKFDRFAERVDSLEARVQEHDTILATLPPRPE